MFIYRIENKHGVGPYVSGAMSRVWETTPVQIMPEPGQEAELKHIHAASYHFGFNSLTNLEKWFSFRQLRILFEMGFEISVYETDTAHCSKTQVAFRKESAQFIRHVELKCLLTEIRSEMIKIRDEKAKLKFHSERPIS